MSTVLMQLEGVRLVAGDDGKTRIERRRFWGLWWQRVKRLPLVLNRGLVLDEADATKTPRGWCAKMVWTENGRHFMGQYPPPPPSEAPASQDRTGE